MRIIDADASASMVLLDHLLPDYLTDLTPVVVLDTEFCPNVRLVFLRTDHAPEIIVLPETWEKIYALCQTGSESDRLRLVRLSELHSNTHILETDNFHHMLWIRRLHFRLRYTGNSIGGDRRDQSIVSRS